MFFHFRRIETSRETYYIKAIGLLGNWLGPRSSEAAPSPPANCTCDLLLSPSKLPLQAQVELAPMQGTIGIGRIEMLAESGRGRWVVEAGQGRNRLAVVEEVLHAAIDPAFPGRDRFGDLQVV